MTTMILFRLRLAPVLLLAGAALLGCSGAPAQGVVPDDRMTLDVTNGTSIQIDLKVNGVAIGTVPPHSSGNFNYELLRSLPWHVQATTAAGRTLLTLDVRSGDVRNTANGQYGAGARVDLSCGRLDIWSGPPMLGPMPGSGAPGDCA